jgi:amidase
MDLEKDRARNDADVKRDNLLSRTNGIDGVIKAYNLDAILTPGGNGAGVASRAGYPIIAVPFGFVPNNGGGFGGRGGRGGAAFPAGFDPKPAPFGVGFVGAQCSEPKLLEIAFGFEKATHKRVAPPNLP